MTLTRKYHPIHWLTQPTLGFTVGTAGTYELAQHISNQYGFTLAYSLRSGSLPNGVTLNGATGRLTYSGASAVTSSVRFSVAAVGFSSESSPTPITITQVSPPVNLPPVWSTVPAITFPQGTAATYDLKQHVTDPEGDPLTFSVATAGPPAGVTLSSSGVLSYDGTSPDNESQMSVSAVEATASAASTSFTPIPEIAMLAGYAQTVQLGIFHVDHNNRWTPGDLTRTAASHRTGLPWTSASPSTMVDAVTLATISDPFVSYSSTTAELTYTGVDPGTTVRDLNVRLRITATGALSDPFRIRVLRAKTIYGTGAATHPKFTYLTAGQKVTSSFFDAKQLTAGNTDSSPGVLVHLGGSYATEDRFVGNKRFFYLFGEPGNRPILTGDDIVCSQSQIFYVKGFEFINCKVSENTSRTDVPTVIYFTESYQHDGTVNDSGLFNSNATAHLERKVYVWTFQGSNMGDGNTQHQFYVEGRPNLKFHANNIHIRGVRQSSACKSTAQHYYIWNSDISGVDNEADPAASAAAGHAAAILLDCPAISNIIVYNNRIATYSANNLGQIAGAMFWRCRKPSVFGSDIPAYPNVDYDAGTTSQTTFSAPPGFTSGTETFKSAAFWAAVNAKLPTDETNPQTFKHFVSYNQFVLLPGSNQTRILRDDGTHPVKPEGGTGTHAVILPTHPDWSERSVTFFANNRYTGWSATGQAFYDNQLDMTDFEAVVSVQDNSTQGSPKWRTSLSAPGNGRIVPANVRTNIGGELIGSGTFAPVTLPTWFETAFVRPPPPVTLSVMQQAIDIIGGPYQLVAMDVPDLAETTVRLDPFNPDGVDYPDNAGGQTTNTYSLSRGWIWGSRFCWDSVTRRALGVPSPHGFDEFNGYHNGFITLLSFYDEDTNGFIVMENPFSATGNDTGVPNGVQNPLTVGHLFDTQCIRGRHLLKMTHPRNPGGGVGFRQPQLMAIPLDSLTTDVTSGRNGASSPVNLGRPSDTFPAVVDINDITAPAVDAFPNGDVVMLHKSTLYRLVAATGQWTITDLGFAVTNAFHNVGHYHQNTGLFIGGGGAYAGTSTRNFEFVTVSQAGVVTHLDNAPIAFSVSETDVSGSEVKCVFVPDPNSTESLVFSDNGNIYGVDPTRVPGTHWRTITTISAASAGVLSFVDWGAALWDRGAILLGKSNAAGAAKLYAFRGA